MLRRKRPVIRPLLLVLILVIGPVHAQTLFACAMMDTVVHDTCCCDDHEQCADSDCDGALETEREPCCEISLELSIDHGSDQTTRVSKPVEVRSDVDPPPAILVAPHVDMHPYRVVTVAYRPATNTPHQPGSQIYLVTQRLRI